MSCQNNEGLYIPNKFTIEGVQTSSLGDSAHGVVIVSDEHGFKHALKIAPHEKIERDCTGLAEASRLIGQCCTTELTSRGQIDDNSSFMTTLYLPDLTPFSRRKNLTVPLYGTSRTQELGEIARLAARLHFGGFEHGDFQAKNVGLRANGKLVVFDFEAHKSGFPVAECMAKDVLTMLKSLSVKGFGGLTSFALAEVFTDSFIVPYIEAVPELIEGVDIADRIIAYFHEWCRNGGQQRAVARFNN